MAVVLLQALLVTIVLFARETNQASDWKYGVCPESNGCECVDKTLNCTDRGITRLSSFAAFTGVAEIDTLRLDHNRITIIPRDAFQGLQVLVINISDNQILRVSDNAFSEMDSVTMLVMDRCKLMTVPAAITKLRSLKVLSLVNNLIATLPERIFNMLPGLEELLLAKNGIEFLSPFRSFNKLKHLKHLDLSTNELYSISSEVLGHLTALETLNLNYNNIESLPANIFQNNTNLSAIYLLNNTLTFEQERDTGIFNELRGLEELEISNCRISNIGKNMLAKNNRLRKLTLKNCAVEHVDLTALDKAILKRLNHLDISGSENIWNAIKKRLHTAGSNLQVLKLSSLNLDRIPISLFQSMKNVVYLEMRSNRISRIDNNDLSGLKAAGLEIHLENNQISGVSPFLFRGTTPPLSLYLNNNNMTSIEFMSENMCAFDRSIIDLTGNKIQCSCSTVEIVQQKLFANLIGTCSESPKADDNSKNVYSGLSLAPKFGVVPQQNGDQYLEEVGIKHCDPDLVKVGRINEKYDCCSEEWVPVGTPSVCAVISSSTKLSVNGYMGTVVIVIFAAVRYNFYIDI